VKAVVTAVEDVETAVGERQNVPAHGPLKGLPGLDSACADRVQGENRGSWNAQPQPAKRRSSSSTRRRQTSTPR
jgi:hypothetical protein